MNNLIRIILNSLQAQFHRCKRIPSTVIMDIAPSTRQRDMSQPSIGGTFDRNDECTPPISPLIISEGTSGINMTTPKLKQGLYGQKSAPIYSRKYPDSSLDADDTESELVAIPESDASESTLNNNSAPGSFDEALNVEELGQLKSEQLKGKVTTANFATAQVALTTLGMAERERFDEVKPDVKKSKIFMKLNSLDRIQTQDKKIMSSTLESSRIVTKCSLQEGVRMMVTPSIFMTGQTPVEKAIVNPPVTVQRAVIVTQEPSKLHSSETSKLKEITEVDNAKLITTGSLDEKQLTSEANITNARVFGRQKRIVEANTPSSASVSHSSSNEESRPTSGTRIPPQSLNTIDRITEFGSPDTPLSKMSIMPTPGTTPSAAQKDLEGLLSPKR